MNPPIAYFGAASRDVLKMEKAYQRILDTISNSGYALSYSWFDKALKEARILKEKDKDSSRHHSDVMRGIRDAQVVIFEVSSHSLAVGQQLGTALSQSKPTLVLSDQDYLNRLFLNGSKSSFLTVKKYDGLSQLEEIIAWFLKKHQDGGRVRFNLSYSKQYDDFISFKAYNNPGMTKTDVIINALDEQMKKDIDYQEYLAATDKV